MKRTWLSLVPFGLLLPWWASTGCATDGVIDEADGATDVLADATSDTTADTKPVQDTGVRDTSRPDTSRPDAETDTSTADAADAALTPLPGEDFDTTAPKEGDACPPGVPLNDLVSRRCGKCGTQRAFCETGRVVGAYGPCIGEKTNPDACLPKAREVGVSCGLCGSQVRLCDTTCTWSTGVCLNEVQNGCVANEITYVEGVCADPAHTRKQTCSAACVRGAPEPCAAQAPDVLVAPQTRLGATSGVFSLTSVRTLPRLNTGACQVTSSTIMASYHWARITNPGADSVNVTVTQAAPPAGTKPNTYIAAYVGLTAPPADAAERQACTDQVRDTPESLTFSIPAGESAFVLTQAAAAASTGKVKLDVVTNFVGPETPPPVDTIVTLDPVMGQTVTAPVTFVATQTVERVNTGACPRTLSTLKPAYRYLRLDNPTGTDRTADIWLATGLDTVIGVYPGPTPPISTARGQCVGEIADGCAAATGITGANSCLGGVTVPANGSIVVYASGYSLTSGATTFHARTTN
jgi:hypothetical protein